MAKQKSNNSTIKYKGSVTILYKDRKGKYRALRRKNAGEIPLFTFLTYALQGKLMMDLIPKYLDAYGGGYDENTKKYTYRKFIQPIPKQNQGVRIYGNNLDIEKSDKIQYMFLVPSANILQTNNAESTSSATAEVVDAVDETASTETTQDDSNYINYLLLKNSKNDICATIHLGSNERIAADFTGNLLIYWVLSFSSNDSDDSDDVE